MPDSNDPRIDESPEVPADDAVIAKALWWSLGVFLVLVGIVGAVLVIDRRGRGPGLTRVTRVLPPESGRKDGDGMLPPSVRFVDITASAGVTFLHHNGATGEKLLPETMGSGVAFFDFDGDGDPDLFFVNGAPWPWTTGDDARPTRHALYRNDDGRFVEVTEGSGLDVGFQGMGVACGDYDNDGRVDLFVTGVGDQRLFRNEGGGRFLDVTAALGVGCQPTDWGTSSAFVDFDRDGDLDLFVCQYLRWSREIDIEVDYRRVGIGRSYGQPFDFPATFPRLYRNEGGSRFVDVSAASGVQVRNRVTGLPVAKSLGVAPVDFNQDGWVDLIVANDTVQNFVFSNRWNGTFAEIGAESGLAFDTFGAARGAMGIDAGRFAEDESLGVSIGNFANEMLALYVTQPDALVFADEAIGQGLGAASRLSLTFGVFFFDYDLDGWLDLLTANGHIESDINRLQASQHYQQPAQVYWNSRGIRRGGKFQAVLPSQVGEDLFQPIVGRGSAYADIDGDGDLDVVIAQNGGRPLLVRNDQELGHGWIRFRLTGSRSNRDAIGAQVRLRSGSHVWWRQVMPTRGYLSQSELPVTFGLGRSGKVDGVEIIWPSGIRQKLAPSEVRTNAMNEVREPAY